LFDLKAKFLLKFFIFKGSHHSSRHSTTDELKNEVISESSDVTPEEDEGSPQHIPRGPSPEPKIEDTECHRSQSAM